MWQLTKDHQSPENKEYRTAGTSPRWHLERSTYDHYKTEYQKWKSRVFEERRPIQLHTERIAQEDLLALARKMHHRYWEELRRMRHAPGSTMPLVSVEQAVDDGAE
ncbi:MAG: hypothetical protein IPN85_18175 [Flavobacteriales bacterium]|nr:hypothetical protein [Flavobacteriales bacterium]